MPEQKSFVGKSPPLLRPQSALGSKRSPDSPKQSANSTFRPWTTHSRQRSNVSAERLMRPSSQQLRRSHLKAAGRQRRSEVAKPFGLTAIADTEGENGEDDPSLDMDTVIASPNTGRDSSPETAVSRTQEDNSQDTRTVKRHPSFEAWVSGSPHDSDEYNTDLEDGETNAEPQSRPQRDASGVSVYEEQCKKHGFTPVSYLRRHLGKRTIRMRHHYLGGNAARPLAYAFRHNTVTETLDLSDNYLQSSGACCLAAMMRDNNFIVSLNLSNNFIGSEGCGALADMLDVNTTLKALSLSGNQLNDRDAFQFIEPLKNNMSLSSLDLSHNNLAEMAGFHMGAVLRVNDGVNDLDLSWNSIRKSGAVALVNALKVNTLLEVLDLSWNGMGAEGASALQQVLPTNTTLKVLDLTNNRIDTKSAVKLAAGLKKNTALETFILNLNPIKDEGIRAVLDAADVHRNLKFLSLENCGEVGVSNENLQHIQRLEKDKKMLVLHGVAGGYHRNSSLKSVLLLFARFWQEHATDLETAFQQHDHDQQGVLTADETKQCLKAAGLRLTSRQLDLIIDEIDFSQCARLQYKDIVTGRVFKDYHKRRPSRGFSLQSAVQRKTSS